MTWPTDDLNTDALDSQTDTPPRAEFFKFFQRVKAMISARGRSNGIASLGSLGKIPTAQIDNPLTGLIGRPNGIASLGSSGTVPSSQLPTIDGLPVAAVVPTAATLSPAGWLFCNGAAISRTTYRSLFSAIGTAYGQGNGSTTFNLPNMSGRFPVGASHIFPRGSVGGEEDHALTIREMPAHRHGITATVYGGSTGYEIQNRGIPIWNGTTGPTGSGAPHNNMPPFVVHNFIIKAF